MGGQDVWKATLLGSTLCKMGWKGAVLRKRKASRWEARERGAGESCGWGEPAGVGGVHPSGSGYGGAPSQGRGLRGFTAGSWPSRVWSSGGPGWRHGLGSHLGLGWLLVPKGHHSEVPQAWCLKVRIYAYGSVGGKSEIQMSAGLASLRSLERSSSSCRWPRDSLWCWDLCLSSWGALPPHLPLCDSFQSHRMKGPP